MAAKNQAISTYETFMYSMIATVQDYSSGRLSNSNFEKIINSKNELFRKNLGTCSDIFSLDRSVETKINPEDTGVNANKRQLKEYQQKNFGRTY